MDNHLKEAIEIVKAQASVRTMTEDEITSMLQKLARDIKSISDAIPLEDGSDEAPEVPVSKSIKEKSITCLECGQAFKLITKKHLLTHGLTPEEYLEKHGYKKGTRLVCKSLQRERRKKMKEMKLWEKRQK